jgi:hypothetical protein
MARVSKVSRIRSQVHEQVQFIADHGLTLAGYEDHYFTRTADEARSIYAADITRLASLERELSLALRRVRK